MISKTTKSHWRLVYRTMRKAIKVTLMDIKIQVRALLYDIKRSDYLDGQRRFFKKLEQYDAKTD